MKRVVAIGVIVVLAAVPAFATTRLQKLAENRYLLTHKKQTGWAGKGKAMRTLNEKAASLCLILDYKWFESLETEAQGRGFVRTASATMEVKFYKDEAKEDLNSCESLASDEQKVKMQKALDKIN